MSNPVNRAVEKVTIEVRWHDTEDDVNEACNSIFSRALWTSYGCARVEIRGGLYCTLNLLTPKDFNDVPRLALAGHELMHCFLARHEP